MKTCSGQVYISPSLRNAMPSFSIGFCIKNLSGNVPIQPILAIKSFDAFKNYLNLLNSGFFAIRKIYKHKINKNIDKNL